MESHEYARVLIETAEHILGRPNVEFDVEPTLYIRFWDKDKFVAAARAMGGGKKTFGSDDLHFEPTGTCLNIYAPRNLVCRKIQEAKYVCEPLLTEQEAKELGEELKVDSIF